jgi:hypothetical protein
MSLFTFRDVRLTYCPSARGKALSAIALDRGHPRKWYEYIPIFGDRWLRRRLSFSVRTPTRISYGPEV